MITLDLAILYYDNPKFLRNLLTRMYNHTDLLRLKKYINVILTDSGTPIENVPKTVDVLEEFKDRYKITYVRCETEDVRKKVPEGMSDRPASHALNVACREIATGDVFGTFMIGQVPTPTYFSNVLSIHQKSDRAFLLPKRFDLKTSDYHDRLFDVPFDQLNRDEMVPSGGLPDASVRREHWLAVGGWEEDIITIGPNDSDFCSRMTGKLDNGMPSEALHPHMGPFNNYGLEFVQPHSPSFFSLVCNTYGNHIEGDVRKKTYDWAYKVYLDKWGIVKRNEGYPKIGFKVIEY